MDLRGSKRVPSKGARAPKLSPKSDKDQRKRERRFRGMEICLDVQLAIGQCLVKSSPIGDISISEVLSALETEPEDSKILAYFQGTKGGL